MTYRAVLLLCLPHDRRFLHKQSSVYADRPAYIAAWAELYESMGLTSIFYPVYVVETRPIDLTEPNCVGPKGDVINCGNTFLTGDDAKAAQTVLTIPLGMSTGGLPVGANFAGPPGSDSDILSLGLALEKLLGRLPGPAEPPGCLGCTANVTNQTVSPNIMSFDLLLHIRRALWLGMPASDLARNNNVLLAECC